MMSPRSAASGMPVDPEHRSTKARIRKPSPFAFRPGDSGVRVAYQVPYPGNQTKLNIVSPYAADRLAVFAPPTVQVSGGGFAPAGQEQGFNVYMRETVAANTPIQLSFPARPRRPLHRTARTEELPLITFAESIRQLASRYRRRAPHGNRDGSSCAPRQLEVGSCVGLCRDFCAWDWFIYGAGLK